MSFPGRSSEPSIKKKKKKKTSQVLPQLYPILPLPDDLVLNCLARVSRLHYPTLSLVSKSLRSLLASPELYETRSLLGRTESCLYVCLELPPHFNTTWFTLCRRPDLTLKKKKKMSGGNLLVPIPSLQSPPAHSSGLVAVASDIYNIGGSIEDVPSSSVSILDCKSHTWREAPNMLVEREYPDSNVLDGKIYVAGGCEEGDSSKWMEVFDLKTHTWKLVSSPLPKRCERSIDRSAVIEGEILMFGQKGVAYKPKQDRWKAIGSLTDLDLGWDWFSYSVVDNVLYCYSNLDGFTWYDSKIGDWFSLKGLKGLKGLPKFAEYGRVKLADYGGKMAIFWDKDVPSSGYKDKMIWCAVIALQRRSSQEIWGKVEWLDAVLRVPKSYTFECALSATV